MTVSVVGSDSIFSQHIHMLTPVFCSAAPTLVPVKLRSTWRWDEVKSVFVGSFSCLSCVCTQVHMFACLLFAYDCMRHTPTRSRATRAVGFSLRTRARFHEQYNCLFLVEKYVTIEAALVNCSLRRSNGVCPLECFSKKKVILPLCAHCAKFSESGTLGFGQERGKLTQARYRFLTTY
jgi:hypothetical protein